MTHKEAEATFKKCHNKEHGYLLAKHTRLQKRGGAFVVRYHETDVVVIRPNNTYRLNSGGWRTITTKNRINMAIPPIGILQTKGIWHIGDDLFFDGILVESNGEVTSSKASFSSVLETKKAVDSHCKDFIQTIRTSFMGVDIYRLHNHRLDNLRKIPRPLNKGHIKQLWKDILESATNISNMPNPHLLKYLWMAIKGQYFHDSTLIWNLIRNNFINSSHSTFVAVIMRTFIKTRKPMIIDQIKFGGLEL